MRGRHGSCSLKGVRFLAILMILAVGCGSRSDVPGTSPSTVASASTISAPTPSPTPTLRPNPTAGPAVYTSLTFAYRVDIPAGWRRSACQSTPDPTPARGVDTFTNASVAAETGTDIGPANDVVTIQIEDDPSGQTALAWLQSGKMGFSTSSRFEKTTFDGQSDAARIVTSDGSASLAFVVHARGRIYATLAGLRAPSPATEASAQALVMSLHILTDAELADARATLAPPPVLPARSVEEVADTLARGFSQKDTSILATAARDCLDSASENAGGSFRATSQVLSDMQKAFANGFVVTVEPRPIEYSPVPQATGATIRATWKDVGQPQRNVKLMLQKVGNTWYWEGVLYLRG